MARKKHPTSALLLLPALLVLAACSGQSASRLGDPAHTAIEQVEYQTATVSPPPPTAFPAKSSTPRPTATFVPLITPSATATGDRPSRKDVARIDVATAKAMVDAGKAVLVDVRTRATYAAQHIAGAVSLPADQVTRRLGELPTDKLIIFYCA